MGGAVHDSNLHAKQASGLELRRHIEVSRDWQWDRYSGGGKNGAGGELARYKNREQCTYVLEMLMSAFDADERTFVFPTEKELEHAKQRSTAGGGKRHGGS